MAAIDVGPAATDRAGEHGDSTTLLDLYNPANDTGTITSFETWFETEGANVKAGTFYGTAPDYTCRDYETLGTVTAGSKQTFSGLDCDVSANDIVGIYYTAGGVSRDTTGGSGNYYKTGDQFEAGEQTYTLLSSRIFSLYGAGTTGWTGKISGVTNPAKVMGIDVANISKVKGVS